MRYSRGRFTAILAVGIIGLTLAPHGAFGAAAELLGGSKKVKTKESIISTDPALREVDAAFDPVVTDDLAIQSFDLSVLYDTSLVTVNSITLLSPYVTPPGAPAPVFDSTGVHHIQGEDAFVESDGSATPNSDVSSEDLFDIDFDLLPGVPDDTPVTFDLIASDPGNFILALDPTLSDPTLASDVDFTGDDVEDSFVTASDTSGEIASGDMPQESTVPMPAGVWQGAIGAVLLAAYAGYRRRNPIV